MGSNAELLINGINGGGSYAGSTKEECIRDAPLNDASDRDGVSAESWVALVTSSVQYVTKRLRHSTEL